MQRSGEQKDALLREAESALSDLAAQVQALEEEKAARLLTPRLGGAIESRLKNERGPTSAGAVRPQTSNATQDPDPDVMLDPVVSRGAGNNVEDGRDDEDTDSTCTKNFQLSNTESATAEREPELETATTRQAGVRDLQPVQLRSRTTTGGVVVDEDDKKRMLTTPSSTTEGLAPHKHREDHAKMSEPVLVQSSRTAAPPASRGADVVDQMEHQLKAAPLAEGFQKLFSGAKFTSARDSTAREVRAEGEDHVHDPADSVVGRRAAVVNVLSEAGAEVDDASATSSCSSSALFAEEKSCPPPPELQPRAAERDAQISSSLIMNDSASSSCTEQLEQQLAALEEQMMWCASKLACSSSSTRSPSSGAVVLAQSQSSQHLPITQPELLHPEEDNCADEIGPAGHRTSRATCFSATCSTGGSEREDETDRVLLTMSTSQSSAAGVVGSASARHSASSSEPSKGAESHEGEDLAVSIDRYKIIPAGGAAAGAAAADPDGEAGGVKVQRGGEVEVAQLPHDSRITGMPDEEQGNELAELKERERPTAEQGQGEDLPGEVDNRCAQDHLPENEAEKINIILEQQTVDDDRVEFVRSMHALSCSMEGLTNDLAAMMQENGGKSTTCPQDQEAQLQEEEIPTSTGETETTTTAASDVLRAARCDVGVGVARRQEVRDHSNKLTPGVDDGSAFLVYHGESQNLNALQHSVTLNEAPAQEEPYWYSYEDEEQYFYWNDAINHQHEDVAGFYNDCSTAQASSSDSSRDKLHAYYHKEESSQNYNPDYHKEEYNDYGSYYLQEEYDYGSYYHHYRSTVPPDTRHAKYNADDGYRSFYEDDENALHTDEKQDQARLENKLGGAVVDPYTNSNDKLLSSTTAITTATEHKLASLYLRNASSTTTAQHQYDQISNKSSQSTGGPGSKAVCSSSSHLMGSRKHQVNQTSDVVDISKTVAPVDTAFHSESEAIASMQKPLPTLTGAHSCGMEKKKNQKRTNQKMNSERSAQWDHLSSAVGSMISGLFGTTLAETPSPVAASLAASARWDDEEHESV
ncbi:unnamed protein product [Amoebophrya sp. A120]|nr:unnamed protein product [Amoebophrya sp. A120]|eukprot:GSA120T00022799001.1